MDWEKIYEHVRYYSTVVWLNTFGLFPEILFILRDNRKVRHESIKQQNRTELRKDIIKLLFFLGALLLCINFFLLQMSLLMFVAIAFLLVGFLGIVGETFIAFIAIIVDE